MYNSRSPTSPYYNKTIVRDLDFEANWLNEKEKSEQDANPVSINMLVTRIQNRTVINLLSDHDSPPDKSNNPYDDFSLSRVKYECPSSKESDNITVEVPLNEARELKESVSELSAPKLKSDTDEDTPDSDFERQFRSLSSKLKTFSSLRNHIQDELCVLIEDRRRFSEQEREILIRYHSKAHRSKRARFDHGEANRLPFLKNVLAKGDYFNLSYTGLYGTTKLVAARVGQFIIRKPTGFIRQFTNQFF